MNVTQVYVDVCAEATCGVSSGCSGQLSVSDKPSVLDCGSVALVTVSVEAKAVCSCAAREHLHQSCASYPRNPCYNGGMCLDTQGGYR